jgi:ribose-phosphate pyrophosphokinase
MAAKINCPFVVLEKIRRGDRDVEVSAPNIERFKDYQPVLVDDIISTARTMIETVGHIHHLKLPIPVCIGIHAVFAKGAYNALKARGVKEIITCNTIPHESNGIDIAALLSNG